MKKRVAFFVQHMLCGGVENSLINFINALSKEKYDTTIYVISKAGEFVKKAEKCTKLLEIPMETNVRKRIPVGGTKLAIRKCLVNHEYINSMIFLKNHMLGKSKFAELNIPINKISKLKENYDVAICYHLHSPFLTWYVSERVDASIKIAWIHNDFLTTGYTSVVKLKQYLDKYNLFFAVSEQLSNEFIDLLPEYKSNIHIMHNIVEKEKITHMAQLNGASEMKGQSLSLLSVGRLEKRKGFDVAIKTSILLKKSGVKFKWFIIGEGSEHKNLEKLIIKNKLQDFVVLLGNRMNPFPYYKECDIYVQTSRHEGYATTITEALILNKPIVTTNVAGVKEQILDGITGLITECSAESLYIAVCKLLDVSERKRLIKNVNNKENTNENQIEFFESCLMKIYNKNL